MGGCTSTSLAVRSVSGASEDTQRRATIGPVTSKTAMERGLRVDVEAAEHTIDGLVDALLGAFRAPGDG